MLDKILIFAGFLFVRKWDPPASDKLVLAHAYNKGRTNGSLDPGHRAGLDDTTYYILSYLYCSQSQAYHMRVYCSRDMVTSVTAY